MSIIDTGVKQILRDIEKEQYFENKVIALLTLCVSLLTIIAERTVKEDAERWTRS